MGLTRSVLTVMGALLCARAASAQQPGRPQQGPPPQQQERGPWPMMGGMGGGPGAHHGGPPDALPGHLLAHVAELKLTDPQVTKLAAIARRADERHRAMRAGMDSLMQLAPPPTAGALPRHPDAMRVAMERGRQMEREDVRDALAVLTVDQQADAWIMRCSACDRAHAGAPRRGVPR